MSNPGIVVGLAAEAQVARHWGCPVEIGGGGAAGAARAAERLAARCDALISFGLAGGLNPALRPGELLVPARVMDATRSWPTDAALSHALGGATGHTILGGGTVLATLAQKQAAFAHGADAVDLESAAVAQVAARHVMPFAVLRAVCDPAERPLPRAALVALDANGRIGILRVALAILRHPGEVPNLLALGRDAATARQALARRVRQTRLR